jgi:hypothetical protein
MAPDDSRTSHGLSPRAIRTDSIGNGPQRSGGPSPPCRSVAAARLAATPDVAEASRKARRFMASIPVQFGRVAVVTRAARAMLVPTTGRFET